MAPKDKPIKREIDDLVNPAKVGPDWTGYFTTAIDVPPGHQLDREERARRAESEGKGGAEHDTTAVFGREINRVAADIVNNRITRHVRALYTRPGAGVEEDPKTEIDSVLGAHNFLVYLGLRFFELAAVVALGFFSFYSLPMLADLGTGFAAGAVPFGVSTAVLGAALWIIYLHNQTLPDDMQFMQRRNYRLLKGTADDLDGLKDIIEDFGVEGERVGHDYIAESDLTTDPYYEGNSFAFAKAMVLQDTLRRAAQFLEFQGNNLNDHFDQFGMSDLRLAWESRYWWLIVCGMIGVIGLAGANAMMLFGNSISGLTAATIAGVPIWPALHFLVLSGVTIALAHKYTEWYRETRWQLNSAIDWFFRKGEALDAAGIANFPCSIDQGAGPELTEDEVRYLNAKVASDDPRTRRQYERVRDALIHVDGKLHHSIHPEARRVRNAGRLFWADFMLERDPTARLLQRHVKLLQQARDTQSVVQRGYGDDEESVERPASGLGTDTRPNAAPAADARPRMRAMSTLSRREVWRP